MLFSFQISTPNDRRHFICILQPFLELSNAHVTVATCCTASITARSMRKCRFMKT